MPLIAVPSFTVILVLTIGVALLPTSLIGLLFLVISSAGSEGGNRKRLMAVCVSVTVGNSRRRKLSHL